MNVVVFAHDFPYPPNNGGRLDIWNRILAFKKLDHKVFLVAWAVLPDNKSIESFYKVEKVVDELVCFRRKNYSLTRLLDLFLKLIMFPIQPSIVTGCSILNTEFESLHNKIEKFQPTFYFVENIYAAKLAFKIRAGLKIPIFIRSHNIEHIYIKKQLKSAKQWMTKIKLLSIYSHLEVYEKSVLKAANEFFDISTSDLSFWESKGYHNGHWMPPIYYTGNDLNFSNSPVSIKYDVCYVGNLFSPNNLESIYWFLKTVLPRLVDSYKNIKVLIAGSQPAKDLIEYCSHVPNIELIANPINIEELYSSSKVLINPIQFGSGVNIKSVEMLFSNKPVVCTSQAISGLPDEFRKVFHIADNSSQFSSMICSLIENPYHGISDVSQELKKYFTLDYFKINVDKMKESSNYS